MRSGHHDFGLVREMPKQLVLSPEGLDHIKRFEGFRAEAYDDLNPNIVMGPNVRISGTLTIGYGHIGHAARRGNTISEAGAEHLLLEDLERFEAGIKRLVKVPLTQGEYDSLNGFTYNIGLDAFARSTLLRRLNAFDYDGAAMEFERWVYSKGRKLRGLVMRRMAEKALFAGTTSFGFVDIEGMAARAENLLEIGSNVRPDAIEGEGTMKPVAKSKTIWATGTAMAGSVLGYIADFDREVQLVIIGIAGAYLIVNRYLESKAGEH